jgi:hypothetical protein
MRSVSPTGSYFIDLPETVAEDEDGGVFSFWVQGRPLLLQLSSYSRYEGVQVGAAERLDALLKREPLSDVSTSFLMAVDCPDYASVKGVDNERVFWVYAYAVWDDLALMITVSGDERDIEDAENWAFTAVKSIRRAVWPPISLDSEV